MSFNYASYFDKKNIMGGSAHILSAWCILLCTCILRRRPAVLAAGPNADAQDNTMKRRIGLNCYLWSKCELHSNVAMRSGTL